MAPFRDLHYTLRIEPNLDSFTFRGDLNLELTADAPLGEVVLNALELQIRSCVLEDASGAVPLNWKTEVDREVLLLEPEREVEGTLQISVRYEGAINDRMAGFYRSAVRSEDAVEWIAISQFQESDARRAFPCFDHPAAKGTFDIEMVVNAHLTAVSNMPIGEATVMENGKRRFRFETTPAMSTYLVFLGVGRFEVLADPEDSRVRLITPPARSRYGDLGLSFGKMSLAFCENYFQIPYPLGKLDLLSVPDFAFGAMENWGAITFRENLLLDEPATTSKSGRARICEIIAHEITHQWFGNLVTPADWSYLWLNESFATYFGFGIVDHYYPDWGTWDQFMLGHAQSAMDRDGLLETFPMEIPGGEHVVINSSTAPLIYSKGAGILRQIHGYIGEERFRAGLNRYLSNHAYSNAESGDFWTAFDSVSGMPVSDIMKKWVEQKGFPLVTAHREGHRLRLTQERFTYLSQESRTCWPIPATLRLFGADGTARDRFLLFTNREATVEIGDATAWELNPDRTGFYRVRYADPENLEVLGEMARDGALSERDRWGLQADLFALVLAGKAALSDYLGFAGYLKEDTAFLPAAGLEGSLFQIFLTVTSGSRRAAESLGLEMCEHVIDAIGRYPIPEEPHVIASMREQIIWHGAIYGSETISGFAFERFEELMTGKSVPPDILQSVLKVGALQGGGKAFQWLRGRLETTASEHERLALLQAMGSAREAGVLRKSFDYVLDHVPDRNRFVPLVAMAANPHGAPVLWEAFLASQERFDAFHPLLYERVLGAIITGCGLEFPDAVKDFSERHLEAKDLAKDVIRLSLERLEILLRLRSRA